MKVVEVEDDCGEACQHVPCQIPTPRCVSANPRQHSHKQQHVQDLDSAEIGRTSLANGVASVSRGKLVS
jgi:hypothetical protein